MRVVVLIATVFMLVMSGPAAAQDWREYASRQDLFRVNLPGEPAVRTSATLPISTTIIPPASTVWPTAPTATR
jgi:hypothetical protein